MYSLLSEFVVTINDVDANQNPDLSFGSISFLTLEAVLEVVIICLAGFAAAKTGLLSSLGQKVISQLNVDVFTPCLVFTKLAPSLSINKMADIMVIPIFYALTTVTSLVCARTTAAFMSLTSAESDYVTAMAVFGNSNSLPVSLTLALAYTLPDLLWDQVADDNADKVASRGILYLLIFQQLGQVLRWLWGYNKLLRKRSHEELAGLYSPPIGSETHVPETDVESALFIGDSTPQTETAVEDDRLNADDSVAGVSSDSGTEDDAAKDCVHVSVRSISTWRRVTEWAPVRGFLAFMNPPLYAMALSIVVASVPVLQKEFFYSDSFIHNTLTQSISQLGLVSIPLILIVLGSNLYPLADIPAASKRYNRIVFASLISRMILPSLILLPVIAVCVKYVNKSILDDPIFLIVAFVLTVSPPAIQLSQITQLNGIFQKEMAGVLFWGYVVLTLPTTIFIVVASLEVLKWAA